MSIPDKFLKIKDSYEVLMLAAKIIVLQDKHKNDKPLDDQTWYQKLLNKASYLGALPLVWPAYDNIANCLNEIKVPANLTLLGEAAVELLDMPDDNKEARVEKVITTFCAFAGATEEAFV